MSTNDALDETIIDIKGKIRFQQRIVNESDPNSDAVKDALKKIADYTKILETLDPQNK